MGPHPIVPFDWEEGLVLGDVDQGRKPARSFLEPWEIEVGNTSGAEILRFLGLCP